MLPNLDFVKTVLNGVNLRISEALGIAKNAILKTEQRLTDSEKKTARANIGAASADNAAVFTVHSMSSTGEVSKIDRSFDEIQDAILSGRTVQFSEAAVLYPLVGFGKNYMITFGMGTGTYDVSINAREVTHSVNSGIKLTDIATGKIAYLRVENGQINIRSTP